MSDYPIGYTRDSLTTIRRKVEARRKWWAARKQLSVVGGTVTMCLNARPACRAETHLPATDQLGAASDTGLTHNAVRGSGERRGAAPLISREVEDWNAESSMFGDDAADAARPASLSAASRSASAPARNYHSSGVRGG